MGLFPPASAVPPQSNTRLGPFHLFMLNPKRLPLPFALGGGGNGSGTKRRLVLAVGFQGVYPLVSLWLLSSDEESNITRTSAPTGVNYIRENPAGQKGSKGFTLWSVFGYFLLTKKVT